MTGYFARSVAGHDKGEIYVIIDEDDGFVILSDGRLKPIESPKKKNRKHIQIIKRENASICEKIINGDKDTNEAIKRAIKLYKREEKDV